MPMRIGNALVINTIRLGKFSKPTALMLRSICLVPPTKYRDGKTSLLYYGCGHCNPNTARWLSCDPIEEQGGLNFYGFIGNDLINKIDIFGLQEIDVWAAAFIKPSSITLLYTSTSPTHGVFPFASWLGDNRGFNLGVNSMFL